MLFLINRDKCLFISTFEKTTLQAMLRFFRRIRQNLLSQNKFSKYLLYAVGEIFLVVIGILIALQLNKWNEGRKDDLKAQKALVGLVRDVNTEKQQNFRALRWTDSSLRTARLILNQEFDSLDPGKIYDRLSMWSGEVKNNATYESLINSNALDILGDGDLKDGLARFYGGVYKYVADISESDRFLCQYIMEPMLLENLPLDLDRYDVEEHLKLQLNDMHFRNVLLQLVSWKESKKDRLNSFRKQIDTLEAMVLRELAHHELWIDVPDEVLKSFTGTYISDSGTELSVFMRNDYLYTQDATGVAYAIFPKSANEFFWLDHNQKIRFSENDQENSRIILVNQDGSELVFYKHWYRNYKPGSEKSNQ